jgi:hypothetical protein
MMALKEDGWEACKGLRFVSRPSSFCYRQIDDMALAGSPRRTSFPPFVRGVELPSTLFTSHGTGRYAAIHLCPRSSCKDLFSSVQDGDLGYPQVWPVGETLGHLRWVQSPEGETRPGRLSGAPEDGVKRSSVLCSG